MLNLWFALILIPVYVILWHFQIIMFLVTLTITGHIFLEIIFGFLALKEIQVRKKRLYDEKEK